MIRSRLLCAALLLGLGGFGEGQQAGSWPDRVHSTGRHLAYPNGAPFFWIADTGWYLAERISRADIDWYLQMRASQGFTVVQFVAAWPASRSRRRAWFSGRRPS